MYQLDVIKKTALAKKLGGPPIFHDGFLRMISMTDSTMTLDIEILSQNNPLLQQDTRVSLKLSGVQRFLLASNDCSTHIFVIHDLDIRREEHGGLRMILEAADGNINEVVFESIELTDL